MLVASTGVIGVGLPIDKIRSALPRAFAALGDDQGPAAARAIMTTDPFPKEAAARVVLDGREAVIGGMAKGSGMIEPMMATMLGFVTTDASVPRRCCSARCATPSTTPSTPSPWTASARPTTRVMLLANGAAARPSNEASYDAFLNGLTAVCRELALGDRAGRRGRDQARHGEGHGRRVRSRGADARPRRSPTRRWSRRPSTAAIPNWGRLIAVAGRAGVAFELSRAVVTIGSIVLFDHGRPHDERAPEAAAYLQGKELTVSVDLGVGQRRVHRLDLRPERRVRADQRGLPDLTMAGATTTRKDFLSILDFDASDLERCLELGARLKAERSLGRQAPTADALDGRHVALLFEKPSLRTRTTFEIAVRELGGETFMLQSAETLGQREQVADVARNLERWVARRGHPDVSRSGCSSSSRRRRAGCTSSTR